MQLQIQPSRTLSATQTRMRIHPVVWLVFVSSVVMLAGTTFTTTMNESTPPPIVRLGQ